MSTQIPEISTSTPKIIRASANYHPNLWENEFLTSPNFKESDEVDIKVLELKEEIKRMLMGNVTKPSKKLNLIDEIQRLGIAYHFQSEIDNILENIYEGQHEYDLKDDYGDLDSTSLHFRLLRQHGYRISSEVFNKFKSADGDFNGSLTKDVKGLMSLYEALHLRVHGENILDEALDFTTKHLQSMTTQLGDTSLAKQIQHALKRPLRRGVPRLEARFYMQVYQEDHSHNEVILTFAKMDFNILQKLHQKELSDLQRWWKSFNFSQKLPFIRDRMVESYFWALGFYFEPKYLLARRTLSKVIYMATVIDDTFDVYGTIDELEIFTKALERWDVSALDLLPDYMKYCYEALLDVFNEMKKDIAPGDNAYRHHYAKRFLINDLVKNYLVEATWCKQKYVPTMEEYLQIALPTAGYVWFVGTSFVGMGEIATKEAFEWLCSGAKILKASSLISRLMNDIVGHKFEQKRPHIASAVECYMKQHGLSEEETKKSFLKQIENAWKDINEECLIPTAIPTPLLEEVLNYTRTADFFYKDEDLFTHSRLMIDHVNSLLKDPILF